MLYQDKDPARNGFFLSLPGVLHQVLNRFFCKMEVMLEHHRSKRIGLARARYCSNSPSLIDFKLDEQNKTDWARAQKPPARDFLDLRASRTLRLARISAAVAKTSKIHNEPFGILISGPTRV
jgi:hypothetical protein